MQVFQGQDRVDFGGVVPVSPEVPPHHCLEPVRFKVRPGERSWVQQHFLNVPGKSVPVPDAEMEQFVPSKEEAFEAKRGEHVIDSSQPLRHPVIVRVFGFEEELKKPV